MKSVLIGLLFLSATASADVCQIQLRTDSVSPGAWALKSGPRIVQTSLENTPEVAKSFNYDSVQTLTSELSRLSQLRDQYVEQGFCEKEVQLEKCTLHDSHQIADGIESYSCELKKGKEHVFSTGISMPTDLNDKDKFLGVVEFDRQRVEIGQKMIMLRTLRICQ